jgi:hypothetical protein
LSTQCNIITQDQVDRNASVPALRHARDELRRAIADGADYLGVVLDEVEDLLVEAIQRDHRPIHRAQLGLDEVPR